ncbi:hypothetical protein SAMN05428996_0906 [Quadrisphaera sp. DSM 44207]|nr:hypothetical protein SAMN05428996_0906 [Quadrisphaera sp. DSM 44207]
MSGRAEDLRDALVAPPPDVLPVLSRGKHRNPRQGACFMELASYLAGERWSDHPACTHPLLAHTARYVNDHTSDAGRPRLAALIPSVIGLTSDDPHVDARLALLCASRALPVAAEERQRVLAVAALTCDRFLADLDGRPAGQLEEATRAVLARVPLAARWADRFAAETPPTTKAFRRRTAPHVVGYSVHALALACVPDPDALMREVLAEAVDACRSWTAAAAAPQRPVDTGAWQAACALTGAGGTRRG